MKQEISLLIMIEVKSGLRQKQIDAYTKLAPIVLEEAGCLQYELKAIEEDENKFILIEKWTSKEALLLHDKSSYMIEADKLNPTFRAKPATVIILKDITK